MNNKQREEEEEKKQKQEQLQKQKQYNINAISSVICRYANIEFSRKNKLPSFENIFFYICNRFIYSFSSLCACCVCAVCVMCMLCVYFVRKYCDVSIIKEKICTQWQE